MFKGKTNFRNIRHLSIDTNEYKYGLQSKYSDVGIRKNALSVAENIEYTSNMRYRKRPTAKILGGDDDTGLVSGIGYSVTSISGANYFRCKNENFEKLSGSTWSSVGTIDDISIPGLYWDVFPFYSIGGNSSGTGNSGFASSGNERYIKNSGGMDINQFIGHYITINGESKLITSNTEDTIYIDGIFNTIPSTEAYQIKETTSGMYVIGESEIYCYDPTNGFRDLSGGHVQPDRGVVEHNRLWYVRRSGADVYVHFSELGLGDYFPPLNYIKLKDLGNPTSIKNIQGKIIVYFQNARAEITGDTPDSFSVRYVNTHKGAVAGGSVSNGNNMQFFLSHEGIEMLNAIDNSSVREGLSLSDNIDFHTRTRDRAHGVVADDKYYLSITGQVYIYDIERSFEQGRAIFSTAIFEECSQTGSPVAGEWTCAKQCEGYVTFGQGGNVYQIEHDNPNDNEDINITVTIETGRLNRGDEKLKKIFKRLKQSFVGCERDTTIKTYISYDGGAYVLEDTTTDFIYEVFMSKMARDIKIKLEITQSGSGYGFWEFLGQEVRYNPLTKY